MLWTHFYNSSIKIGSISFFSSSDTQKFNHLLGCHTTDINSSVILFKCFAFFKLNMPSQKSDMNDSIRIIFILISNVNHNIIKIYIKNTHYVTNKYNIFRIFIKIEYIFICVQTVKSILIILLETKQLKKINAAKQSSTTL